MPDTIITHADTPSLTLLQQALQGAPHLLALLPARIRTVDQEQIHIAALARINLGHAIHALAVTLLHAARRREDLGRQKHLVPPNAGLPHRFPHFDLVAVVLCRVDVTVAVPEGVQARGHTGGGWGLVDAETEAGDLDGGVGQGQEVGKSEFDGRGHAGGVVVSFGFGAAFVGDLVFGGKGVVDGMEMSEVKLVR